MIFGRVVHKLQVTTKNHARNHSRDSRETERDNDNEAETLFARDTFRLWPTLKLAQVVRDICLPAS